MFGFTKQIPILPAFTRLYAGGQIHSAYHSATFSNGAPQLLLFGIPLWYEVRTPRVVIQVSEPSHYLTIWVL